MLLCFEIKFVMKGQRIILNTKISDGGISDPYKKSEKIFLDWGDFFRAL